MEWRYEHRDGGGTWHPFDDACNRLIAVAWAQRVPSVRLPRMVNNPAGHQEFEVRLREHATSAKMPVA